MKVLNTLSRMILLYLTMAVTSISGKAELDSDTSFILKKLNDMSDDIASIRSLLKKKDDSFCDCSPNVFPSVSPTKSSVNTATLPPSFMAPTTAPSNTENDMPAIRILPIGDTFTKGQSEFPGGYRKPLWWELKELGYNIDYVGTKINNASPGVDRNHEGTGGASIRSYQRDIEQVLANIDSPDIILLHVGSSDFGRDDDIENAIERYDALIQKISRLRPYAHIITTTLIDRQNSDINDSVNTLFNPFVKNIVKKNVEEGIRVSFLDMNNVVQTEQLVDGIHPNQEGYNKMALAWADAIQKITGPSGDIYAPQVISTNGSASTNEIVIGISKPIADVSVININNFSINNGISVLDVRLDSSKRNIIIETSDLEKFSGQAINVVIRGVIDRTPNKLTLLPPNSVGVTIHGPQKPSLSPVVQSPVIRIMPLGSTLTIGDFQYPGGYRKRVYNMLTTQGWNIDFVGNKKKNRSPGIDPDHEGNFDKKISYFDKNVNLWLDKIDDPDIILLHVGTVDFVKNNNISNAITRYDSLIKKLADARPNAHIIATNLIAKGTKPENNKIKKYFNPFVEDIVKKHANNGVHVSYLDIRQYIKTDQVLNDSFLNQEGYDAMADGWIDAIKKIFTPQGVKTDLRKN